MHADIMSFFARMKLMCGSAFNVERVLECGSYDINGNPRRFFSSAKEYVGIDWRPGAGVDEVSLVHEYHGRPDGYFQFVIATSLIEHDPHWSESIQRMCDLLAIGGSILITCGGPGFHEHEKETSPAYVRGTEQKQSGEYYQNRTVRDILETLTLLTRFERIAVEDDPTVKDIRVFAIGKMPKRAGVPEGWNSAAGKPVDGVYTC